MLVASSCVLAASLCALVACVICALPPSYARSWPRDPYIAEASQRVYELTCSARGADQELVDAGGIVEYEEAWYAAHNFSEGRIFYEFDEGDIVLIDGREVTIEGRETIARRMSSLVEIRNRIGYDVVVFQTCADSLGEFVYVYYGHDANSSGPYSVHLEDDSCYDGEQGRQGPSVFS